VIAVVVVIVVVVLSGMSNSPSPNWFDNEQQLQRFMDPGTPQRQFMML